MFKKAATQAAVRKLSMGWVGGGEVETVKPGDPTALWWKQWYWMDDAI
jgi:hypothetical protein